MFILAAARRPGHDNCCEQPWLLKNSLAESARKNRRARMTYKRFSPDADTFLLIRFKPVSGKPSFSTATAFTTHNLAIPGSLAITRFIDINASRVHRTGIV